MGGIRFYTKIETDGKQTLRIEVPEDVTVEDLESAAKELTEWHEERSTARGRFFSEVREQWQFDRQVHKLSVLGYSPLRIARTANAEILDMLRQYQTEWSELNLKPGTYPIESAIDSIMRMWHAVQWLQRVDCFLIAARPGWTVEQRREEVNALATADLSKADRECLIDRETVRRSIDRWSERIDGKVNPRRMGRKKLKLE